MSYDNPARNNRAQEQRNADPNSGVFKLSARNHVPDKRSINAQEIEDKIKNISKLNSNFNNKVESYNQWLNRTFRVVYSSNVRSKRSEVAEEEKAKYEEVRKIEQDVLTNINSIKKVVEEIENSQSHADTPEQVLHKSQLYSHIQKLSSKEEATFAKYQSKFEKYIASRNEILAEAEA